MSTLWKKYSFILVFIALMTVFGLYLVLSFDTTSDNSFVKVDIQEGDTLWTLAQQYENEHGMKEGEFVEWVTAHNQLPSFAIHAGDELVLPIEEKSLLPAGDDGIELASNK